MVALGAVVFALALGASPTSGALPTPNEVHSLSLALAGDAAWLHLDGLATGGAASDLRHEIDGHFGNSDGTVDASEVASYLRATTVHDSEDHPGCYANFTAVRLAGATPRRLEAAYAELGAAEGPVDSTNPIVVRTHAHYLYPGAAAPAVASVRFRDVDPAHPIVTCGADASTVGFSVQGADAEPSARVPGHLALGPASGYALDRSSLKPGSLAYLWKGPELRADDNDAREALRGHDVVVQVGPPTAEAPAVPPQPAADHGVMRYAAGGGVLAARGAPRWLRRLVPAALFTRIERDRVLDHRARETLHEIIAANPGLSFSDLRRMTELSHGSLVHHLRMLGGRGFVRSVREGVRTRFYLCGTRLQDGPYVTELQREILGRIEAQPGLTQKELARAVELPRESVSYHARRLAERGQLVVAVEGRWRRYFPARAAAPAAT